MIDKTFWNIIADKWIFVTPAEALAQTKQFAGVLAGAENINSLQRERSIIDELLSGDDWEDDDEF